jgi:hypothetical protein
MRGLIAVITARHSLKAKTSNASLPPYGVDQILCRHYHKLLIRHGTRSTIAGVWNALKAVVG